MRISLSHKDMNISNTYQQLCPNDLTNFQYTANLPSYHPFHMAQNMYWQEADNKYDNIYIF